MFEQLISVARVGQSGELLQRGRVIQVVRIESLARSSITLSYNYRKFPFSHHQLPTGEVVLQLEHDGDLVGASGYLDLTPVVGMHRFKPHRNPITEINRRDSFRVEIRRQGELFCNQPSGASRFWNCVVKNLSVGGAALAVVNPPPPQGAQGLLKISLPNSNNPLFLSAQTVLVRTDRPFMGLDCFAHVAFHGLTPQQESVLHRFIHTVQLDRRAWAV